MARRGATFGRQCFRLGASAAKTEDNFGTGGSEHSHRGRADAAGAARDQRNLAGEGERYGHSRLVSCFWFGFASRRNNAQFPELEEDVRSDFSPRNNSLTSMPSKRVPLIFES